MFRCIKTNSRLISRLSFRQFSSTALQAPIKTHNVNDMVSESTHGETDKPIIFAPETYQYDKGKLNDADITPDPIEQFHQWFEEAKSNLPAGSSTLPELTNFSTARLPLGRVSSRVVLLKELDHHGFIIYSNWDKLKKSQDLATNKWASLTFFWPHIQRQVRVEGLMEFVTRETSERYFNTRPRGSKIGAWASPQSQKISERNELDKLDQFYQDKFKDLKDDEIPCPEYWGGVRIVPLEIEFWQGRVSRLHDRYTYTRETIEDAWDVNRIAP